MSTGFGFGTKTTSAQAFGTGSITFGTPATQNQPSFGLGNVGNSQQQGPGGFQLSTSVAPATSSNLAVSQAGSLNFNPSGFGKPTTQSTGLFGTPFGSSASKAPTSSGFGIGTALTSSTPVLGQATPILGTVATAPSTSLPFGTPASTHITTPSFGVPTLPAQGLTFGASTTPATVGGGLFSNTNTAKTTAPTLGVFGTSSSTAQVLTSDTSNVNLGGATPAISSAITTSAGLTFGLGGNTSATPTLIQTPVATTATVNVGLGGVATTQTNLLTTQKEVPLKEQPLPNEILQTVEQFKEMVKQQKLYSSDIARCSVRDFRRVEQEIDLQTNLLTDVESQLHKNRHLAEKLKYDTAKCLQNIEMAQRTQDTPPGLQYENTAPLKYFFDLADQFEKEMQTLKFQIECADKYVKNHKCPDTLTPQDLALGMRRLHETFVALAGRLQSVHSQVEAQKESFLNMRRQLYNDYSNPFEKLSKQKESSINNMKNSLIYSPPKVATGPTPFSSLALGNGNPLMMQQTQVTTPYAGTNTAATPMGLGTSMFGNQMGSQSFNTNLFGNSFGQGSINTSTNFQLQKPPTGNKRGKQ